MPRLNFNVDEATLLKAYKISTLNPTKWEEVDHDFDESIANATTMLAPSAGGTVTDRQREDLLGLGPAKSVKDLDMETKSSLLLSSKTFSPAQYLAFAHPNATYHDLSRGIAHLQKSIEAREEALRVLVEEGFDRFVAVKSAVDGLYEDMKQGILAPQTEHGTQPLRDHLKNGAQKANQIFLPALETVSKTDKLRTTLSVFERSRFFFNLPSFIMESIDAGKYDLALRDYKKGKYLLENRPGQLLPLSSSSGSSGTVSAAHTAGTVSGTQFQQTQQMQIQQRRILNKVWASVEKAMREMRKVLIAQLQDSSRSIEDHERTLETLLELQTGAISNSEDLVWTYFDSHHMHIMDKMSAAHKVGMRAIKIALQSVSGTPSNADGQSQANMGSLVSQLKLAMSSLDAGDTDIDIAKSGIRYEPVWSAILELVKSVSEVISTSLPSFWKVGRDFLEGRFKRSVNGSSSEKVASRRSPRQCRTMVYDIVKLYISLISQTFMLSDVTVMSRSQSSQSSSSGSDTKHRTAGNTQFFKSEPLAIFPRESTSLSTAFHLQKILGEVLDCVGELIGLGLDAPGSSEVKNGLKNLVESLKWRSIDILINEWTRDASLFYHLESWVASITTDVSIGSKRSTTSTQHLGQFEKFQRYMMTAAYKIASMTSFDASSTSSSANLTKMSTSSARQAQGKIVIPQTFVGKVTRGFVDAVYKFVDGLVLLASDEAPVARGDFELVTAIAGNELSLSQLFDLRDANIRLLLVITNMDHFKKVVMPSMIARLEKAFTVSMTEDRAALANAIEQQDQILFEAYIRPQAHIIKEEISKAMLPGGTIDWYRAAQPVALRQYVSEVMNYFVAVHAQVCSVAPYLLDRVIITLIDELEKETSRCIKKVQRFGTGGLLQIVMELTFIHKSLANYGRETTAGKRLEEIYTKQVTQAYAPSSREDKDFQKAFDEMQEILADARRSTGVQFLCFRKMKDKEKEKDGDKEPSRKDKHAGRTRVPRNT